MANDLGKTSTGIQPNVAALLSYVLGVLTGVIFLIIEKENKFVRFHAIQSIITFGGLFVIQIVFAFIPVVGAIIIPIISIASLILWVVLMIKSYQGEKFKLPIVGDMAEKQA